MGLSLVIYYFVLELFGKRFKYCSKCEDPTNVGPYCHKCGSIITEISELRKGIIFKVSKKINNKTYIRLAEISLVCCAIVIGWSIFLCLFIESQNMPSIKVIASLSVGFLIIGVFFWLLGLRCRQCNKINMAVVGSKTYCNNCGIDLVKN